MWAEWQGLYSAKFTAFAKWIHDSRHLEWHTGARPHCRTLGYAEMTSASRVGRIICNLSQNHALKAQNPTKLSWDLMARPLCNSHRIIIKVGMDQFVIHRRHRIYFVSNLGSWQCCLKKRRPKTTRKNQWRISKRRPGHSVRCFYGFAPIAVWKQQCQLRNFNYPSLVGSVIPNQGDDYLVPFFEAGNAKGLTV